MKTVLSPITGKPMALVYEPTTVEYRGETFSYIHLAYRDEETGEQWTDDCLDDSNTRQVYDQYRYKHNIPFDDEIVSLRRHYNVSPETMALVLGITPKRLQHLEQGSVPDVTEARSIIQLRDKEKFIGRLTACRDNLDEFQYQDILERTGSLEKRFRRAGQTPFNGYTSISMPKIEAIVSRLLDILGPTYITKMNKLLFYVDFLNYQKSARGISGLTYNARQFGPVPQKYMRIYTNMPAIEIEERIFEGGGGSVLVLGKPFPDTSLLTSEEIGVIDEIADKFKEYSCKEISEYSHREAAWQAHMADQSPIPYAEAFSLSIGIY